MSKPSLPTLKLEVPNLKGESVLALQMRLGMRGYTIECDGKFGYRTESALKAFQRDQGLKDTGELNESTYELLFGGSK